MESEIERLKSQVRTFQNQFTREQQTNRELSLRLKAAKDDAAAARAENGELKVECQRLRTKAATDDDTTRDNTASDSKLVDASGRTSPSVLAVARRGSDPSMPGFSSPTSGMDALLEGQSSELQHFGSEIKRLEAEVSAFRRVFAAMACGKSLQDALRWEVTFSPPISSLHSFVRDLGLEGALKPFPPLSSSPLPLCDLLLAIGPSGERIASLLKVGEERSERGRGRREEAEGGAVLEPQVLFQHPMSIHMPSAMIPDFCFPQGVHVKTFTQQGMEEDEAKLADMLLLGKHGGRRGPRSHMFILTGSDHDDQEQTVVASAAAARGVAVEARTRYCLCIQVLEPVSRSTLLGYAARAHLPRGATTAPPDIVDDTVLLVPRVYCLVSRYPFFALHFEFLRILSHLWRIECWEKLCKLRDAGYATGIFNKPAPAPVPAPVPVPVPTPVSVPVRAPVPVPVPTAVEPVPEVAAGGENVRGDSTDDGVQQTVENFIASPPQPSIRPASPDAPLDLGESPQKDADVVKSTEGGLAPAVQLVDGAGDQSSARRSSLPQVAARTTPTATHGAESLSSVQAGEGAKDMKDAKEGAPKQNVATSMASMWKSAFKGFASPTNSSQQSKDDVKARTKSVDEPGSTTNQSISTIWTNITKGIGPATPGSASSAANTAVGDKPEVTVGDNKAGLLEEQKKSGDSKKQMAAFLALLSPSSKGNGADEHFASNSANPVPPSSTKNIGSSISQFFGGLARKVSSEQYPLHEDDVLLEDDESVVFDPLLTDDVIASACTAISATLLSPAMLDAVHTYLEITVPAHGSTLSFQVPSRLSKHLVATSATVSYSLNSAGCSFLTFKRAAPPPTHFAAASDGATTEVGSTAALLAQLNDDFLELEAFRGKKEAAHASIHEKLAMMIVDAQDNPVLRDAEPSGVPPHLLGCDLDHPETQRAIKEWASPLLFSLLPLDSIMLLVGAALTEQKIIVVGGQVSQEATACCVVALAALLRPLSWVGPFLPTLPSTLDDILSAPIPVLVGVPRLPDDFEQDEQTVLVLLDKEAVRVPAVRTPEGDGQGDSVHLLPGFLEIQLPDNSVLYHRLEPVARFLRLGSGSGSGKVIGKDVVNPRYKPNMAQVAAADALATAINEHIRRLLSRLLVCGIASQETPATRYPAGLDPSSAQIARLVPALSTCVASMLEAVPEVEAPFWSRFCSSQMLSFFYENRQSAVQAAAMRGKHPAPAFVAPEKPAPVVESPLLSTESFGTDSLPTNEQRSRLASARRAARDARLAAAARHSGAAAASLRRMSAAIDIRNVTLGPASYSNALAAASEGGGEVYGFQPSMVAVAPPLASGVGHMRRSTMAWSPATPAVASATIAIRSRESLGHASPPPPPPRPVATSVASAGDIDESKGIGLQAKHGRRNTSGLISPSSLTSPALPPRSERQARPPHPNRASMGTHPEDVSDGEGKPSDRASVHSFAGLQSSDDEAEPRARRSTTPIADAVLSADAPLDVVAEDVQRGIVSRRSTVGTMHGLPAQPSHARRRSAAPSKLDDTY